MRVLITGVAGFLGSHLADAFLKRGDSVVGIDNLLGGYMENVPKGVEFHRIDLSDLDSIEPCFHGVDLVVHAACTAYEGLSVFSPALVSQNTYQITATTLSASVRNGVKKFVFMSSMARYGTQESVPFTEKMTPNPQDPYGISKLAAELLVKNICMTHSVNYVILVPHNIIGPRQKFDDPYRNVASIMINRILQGKSPIIYGDGSQRRCFSFIQDVVSPIISACLSATANSEVINIGPDEEFITINNLARKISRILGFNEPPIYLPERPKEVKDANCSADLARKLLGYNTAISLDEGLIQLTDWIKVRGPKPFSYHLPLEFSTPDTPKTWSDELMNE
jgi:UDP-glucose 4-epimerase